MGQSKVTRAELIPLQLRIMGLQLALDCTIDVLVKRMGAGFGGTAGLRAEVEAEVKRRSDALRERAEKMRAAK